MSSVTSRPEPKDIDSLTRAYRLGEYAANIGLRGEDNPFSHAVSRTDWRLGWYAQRTAMNRSIST